MKQIYGIALAAGCALSLQAGTLLSFDIETKTALENDSLQTNFVETSSSSVYLGSSVIDIQAGDAVTVYDYPAWKIYHSVPAKDGFEQSSLYTDLGFRTAEFQNRLHLGSALAAAGIADNPMDRVLMEHLFSLRSDEAADLTREETAAAVSFSHKDKPLFTYSTAGTAVPQALLKPFIIFLSTQYGIHPDIADALAQQPLIPERMVIHRCNTGKTDEISLHLTRTQFDAPRPTRSLQQEIIPGSDPVFALAEKTREMEQSAFDAACGSMLARAPKRAEEGRLLDAACLFISLGLATGTQQMPPAFFDWKDQILADPDVAALFTALSPRSREEAEKAAETLGALTAKASDGRFTLLIFKANTLESLGQPAEAAACFLEALEQEPAVTGAWKDLGDVYYQMYRPRKAWACWNTARALNPNHPFIEDIQALEDKLRHEHPEFLLPVPSK